MKTFTKTSLLLLLLSFTALQAQTVRVIDAPDWFFHPQTGEYTGVSLPVENKELAQQQAIYSALLSFIAQNETEVFIKGHSSSFSSKSEEAEESHFTSMAILNFSLPDNYRIVRTAINQYGEIFVALKIIPVNVNENIKVFIEQYINFTEKNSIVENTEKFEFSIVDRCLDQTTIKVHGNELNINNETEITVQLSKETPNYHKNETFLSNENYFYPHLAENKIVTKKGAYPNFKVAYAIKYSLGMAYIEVLLRNIIYECERVKMDLSKSVLIHLDGDDVNNDSDKKGASDSHFENKVVKPSQIFKILIDEIFLYLADKETNE